MPVGLVMAICAKEAISHGAAPKVAKLRLASTALPLLIAGFLRSAGCGSVGADIRWDLMREMGAAGAGWASSNVDSASFSEEIRRRFLG